MDRQSVPTLTAKRRDAIVGLVVQQRAVRVVELADRFGVDVSTIRRDLQWLDGQGKLQRVHGGAVPSASDRLTGEPDSVSEQEARIGRAVADMVDDGETVFLGPGNLCIQVARSLALRPQLTIVTNGLAVAHWVASNTSHTLIVTGGQAEGDDRGLVGQLTRTALAGLRADRVVLELSGVSAVGGLTDDDLAQAEIAQMLFEIGSEVMALVPVERVGRVAAAFIAPITEVDIVVTGREAPSAFLWDLSESGVKVVLA